MKHDVILPTKPASTIPEHVNVSKQARHAAQTLRLPTKKQEHWKYAPCQLLQERFLNAITTEKNNAEKPKKTERNLATHNTDMTERPQNHQGVHIYTLEEAYKKIPQLMSQYCYTTINQNKHYFSHEGIANQNLATVIHVPKNTCVSDIYTLNHHYSNDYLSHYYQLVIVEENSQLKLLRKITATGQSFSNITTEVILKENAQLSLYHIQDAGTAHTHINGNHIQQYQGSTFESFNLDQGGCISRTDIDVQLKEKNASCKLLGSYHTEQGQYIDHHNEIKHMAPHCSSHEHFRGILAGKSSAVFNGKIYIGKDAQQTTTSQLNKNILLSPHCEIYTKPELEIYADDVKATHGATVGQLDREALHYLQCRGIPQEQAKSILVGAFTSSLLDEVSDPILHQHIINAQDKQKND
jgi:Fe-S cluster assembly protein SufD